MLAEAAGTWSLLTESLQAIVDGGVCEIWSEVASIASDRLIEAGKRLHAAGQLATAGNQLHIPNLDDAVLDDVVRRSMTLAINIAKAENCVSDASLREAQTLVGIASSQAPSSRAELDAAKPKKKRRKRTKEDIDRDNAEIALCLKANPEVTRDAISKSTGIGAAQVSQSNVWIEHTRERRKNRAKNRAVAAGDGLKHADEEAALRQWNEERRAGE